MDLKIKVNYELALTSDEVRTITRALRFHRAAANFGASIPGLKPPTHKEGTESDELQVKIMRMRTQSVQQLQDQFEKGSDDTVLAELSPARVVAFHTPKGEASGHPETECPRRGCARG